MKKKTWGIHTFMAIPAFLLFAVFFLYPLGRGLQMSLTNWDGIGKAEFIGLGNFRSFFRIKELWEISAIRFCSRWEAPRC